VYQVLLGEKNIADVRVRSDAGGFDLVPSNRELAGAEVELVELPEREMRLKDALAHAIRRFDVKRDPDKREVAGLIACDQQDVRGCPLLAQSSRELLGRPLLILSRHSRQIRRSTPSIAPDDKPPTRRAL